MQQALEPVWEREPQPSLAEPWAWVLAWQLQNHHHYPRQNFQDQNPTKDQTQKMLEADAENNVR
jgi:hypothetical protein